MKEEVVMKENVLKEENDKNFDEDSMEDENDEEMSIALRVKCRKMAKLSPITFSCQISDSDSASVKSDPFENSYVSVMPDETFIDSL